MASNINDIALRLRASLYATARQKEITRRIIDYMCAAHVFHFIGLNAEYTMENLWYGFNAEYGALTNTEESILTDSHGVKGHSRFRELLVWAMVELQESSEFVPPPLLGYTCKMVQDFHDASRTVVDIRYQPIPFVLVHMVSLVMLIFLPLQTYDTALATEKLTQNSSSWA